MRFPGGSAFWKANCPDGCPKARGVKFDITELVRPTLPERVKAYQVAGGGKPWLTIEEIRQQEGLPYIDPEELMPAAPTQNDLPTDQNEDNEDEEGYDQKTKMKMMMKMKRRMNDHN